MFLNRSASVVSLTLVSLVLVVTTCFGHGQENSSDSPAPWTVMIYGGVDSSAEDHIMPHLQSLKKLSSNGQRGEVLLLIDRIPGHSKNDEVFGEDFVDTRLFQLKDGSWLRVSGGKEFPEIDLQSTFEANSGDAETLKKFIRFGKAFAPAQKYALLVFGHGDCRLVCPDVTSPREGHDETDDPLYTTEITDGLSQSESVDLIWFDVCSFGAIENAYQLRPGKGRFSAKAMLATPPVSSPAPMADIFRAIGIVGSVDNNETLPADGVAFGVAAIDFMEQHFKKNFISNYRESWGCYDLTAADDVKKAVDQFAVALAESGSKDIAERLRGEGKEPLGLHYLHTRKGSPRMWVVSPHFDLYDLARRFTESEELTERVRSHASDVMKSVDRFVAASVAGRIYKEFEPGKNGVFILFPDGDSSWRDKSQWSTFGWYHPFDRAANRYEYGKYAWCGDGASPNNQVVENWFELMDAWFDTNDSDGGVNQYRW